MPNFVSFTASIAELAHGEKLCTQSPSLFDDPGIPPQQQGCWGHSVSKVSHGWLGSLRPKLLLVWYY